MELFPSGTSRIGPDASKSGTEMVRKATSAPRKQDTDRLFYTFNLFDEKRNRSKPFVTRGYGIKLGFVRTQNLIGLNQDELPLPPVEKLVLTPVVGLKLRRQVRFHIAHNDPFFMLTGVVDDTSDDSEMTGSLEQLSDCLAVLHDVPWPAGVVQIGRIQRDAHVTIDRGGEVAGSDGEC